MVFGAPIGRADPAPGDVMSAATGSDPAAWRAVHSTVALSWARDVGVAGTLDVRVLIL
jgi:hypothetical protein